MFPRDESGGAGRPPSSQDHPEFCGGKRCQIEMTKSGRKESAQCQSMTVR